MLPENNTGKDVAAVERTHNIKMAKQRAEPSNEIRTPTATLENIATDKLDPTIGSTRENHQDRNPTASTEPILTTSSISKPNRGEHSKQADERKGALRYKTGR
jgi:hypothetical protein